MANDKQLHVFMDESTGEISLSPYSPDEAEYESNHLLLVELRHGRINKHESLMNIVTNILRASGVNFVQD